MQIQVTKILTRALIDHPEDNSERDVVNQAAADQRGIRFDLRMARGDHSVDLEKPLDQRRVSTAPRNGLGALVIVTSGDRRLRNCALPEEKRRLGDGMKPHTARLGQPPNPNGGEERASLGSE